MTVGREPIHNNGQPSGITAWSRLRRALLALTLLGAALAYTAPPAEAQGQYHICCTGGLGVFLRLGSPSFSAPKAPGPNDGNYNITVFCQTTGDLYNGVNIWDYISFNGNTGYINDSFLWTGYSSWDPRLPRCGATPPPPVPAESPATSPVLVPFVGSFRISATWGAPSRGYHKAIDEAIDFELPAGTPVYAAGFGTVVKVTNDPRNCNPAVVNPIDLEAGISYCSANGFANGVQVVINHPNGRSSRYLHMSSLYSGIAVNATVQPGQQIGFSGNSGISTGPHLHYQEGIIGGDTSVDPGVMSACQAGAPFNYDNMQSRFQQFIASDGFACATVAPQFLLSVAKAGTGSGVVSSTPAGINCGSTCSASYNSGTPVTLAATPSAGSTFTGWSGACAGTGTCTVTVDAAKSVTATFTLNTYVLTVTKVGAGAGTVSSSPAGVSCGVTCSASFGNGSSVTLTPTPVAGSVFGGWSGACTGTGACVVSMDAAKSVRALFVPSGSRFQVFAAPQRMVDTRAGQRGVLESSADEASALTAGEVRRYVPGPVVGVPSGGSLMVTAVAVAPSAGGFLVAWPCAAVADPAPAVSMLNYQAGVTISNNGIVRLDPATGGLCVKSSAAAHVVLDTYGWFASSSTYSALSQPQRLFDTRPGQGGVLERLVDEAVPYAGTTVHRYVVAGAAGIPVSGAVAVAVNVAAVGPTGSGEIRLYPCAATTSAGSISPLVVFSTGSTVSAGGTVSLAADGGFCVRATAGTHVIVDATGWYTALNYRTFATPGLPKLLVDTRGFIKGELETVDTITPLAANTTYRWALAGKAGFPVAAQISSVRVTVTELAAAATGFISVWACDSTATPPPATALLNYRPLVPIAGSVIVPVAGADAGICVRTSQPTHIALNTTHWIAP